MNDAELTVLSKQLLVLAQVQWIHPLVHLLFSCTRIIPWAVVPETQHELGERDDDGQHKNRPKSCGRRIELYSRRPHDERDDDWKREWVTVRDSGAGDDVFGGGGFYGHSLIASFPVFFTLIAHFNSHPAKGLGSEICLHYESIRIHTRNRFNWQVIWILIKLRLRRKWALTLLFSMSTQLMALLQDFLDYLW